MNADRGLDLGAARSQWLEHLARDRRLARTTLITYGSALHVAFQGLSGHPSEAELRAAIDARLSHPSGHVRRQSFGVLSLFLQWWQQHGGPANSLAEAKPPPKPGSRRSALQGADLEALERRLPGARPKDRAEVLLMLRAGFRVGDVVGLKAEDIDSDRGRVRCREGKGGTDTWLPMTDSVARALHEHLSDAGITTGYVFTGPNGPMTGQAIWKAWKRVAGPELDHFAAHQLRNTFANQMVRGGTNLNSVRRLMRHASLTTTQRYLDDDEELERAAVRALDGLTPADPRPEQVAPRPEPRPTLAPEPPPVASGDLSDLKSRSDLRFILAGASGQKTGWPKLYQWLSRRLEAGTLMAHEPIWLSPSEWVPGRQDVPVFVDAGQRSWSTGDEAITCNWGDLLAVAAGVALDHAPSRPPSGPAPAGPRPHLSVLP